jgi:hypothetical protein
MREPRFPVTCVVVGLLAIVLLASCSSPSAASAGEMSFRTPANPPRAEYVLDAAVAVEGDSARVTGTGTITLSNPSSRPLSVLGFDWSLSPAQTFDVSAAGRPLRRLNEERNLPLSTPIFYELPVPLRPGRQTSLDVRFTYGVPTRDGQIHLQAWYPHLWWEGIPVRDSFKVKLDWPRGYAAAVSGRLNPASGRYENGSVTTRFAVFLTKTLKQEERESEGVLVRALFTDKGAECARLCLDAAADIIAFYRKWLGVYPHRSLCIIPGGSGPWGGYPYASGIVVIHGEETYDPKRGEKEANWWRWITAHEIGHQYWGEYIMPGDVRGPFTDSWLMIGMGINMDKTYMLGRGYGWQRHRGFIDGYLAGVREGDDTTMDAPPSLARTQKYDTNNVLIHGKGFAVVSALETVLGKGAFDAIFRRTVQGFGGRRLGWREFRRLCETDRDEDLGWFFEDWVRSNKVLECRITGQSSTPQGDGFSSEVRVEFGLNSIRMPVPVRAVFEDGTSELRRTDRFARVNVLRFESRSKLKEAQLDPEGRLAVVKEPPARTGQDLADDINALDWTGTGEEALAIFERPEASGIKEAHAWFKLGLLLFDGRHYPESFEAFQRCGELDRSKNNLFGALVWMGNLKDLLGERAAAVGYYREALQNDPGYALQHDQYGLRIDKAWIEERLKTPYKWNR